MSDEYEQMVQAHFQTIEHIKCRRQSVKGCYNGVRLDESIYSDGRTLDMQESRANYLSDGTLADDGTVVCDACYVGF